MTSPTENARSPWISFLVNKVFVVSAFVLVLGTALFRPETLKMRSS